MAIILSWLKFYRVTTAYRYPSILTIAGFDGSGGAGIQADIKTISALGCYATSVLTALPVQNTLGVKNVYPIPAAVVQEQINTICEDLLPDAIKIGMIHTAEQVSVIAECLQQYPELPVILDPVMVSSSGQLLMQADAIKALKELLLPRVTLLTPNMDEASVLAGMEVRNLEDMYLAGAKILELGCPALLLKGGHLDQAELTSLYFAADGRIRPFKMPKIDSQNTHGTGCTLSAAIAAYLALGHPLEEAIALGQDYVQKALIKGKDVYTGKGHGALNHFFDPKPAIRIARAEALQNLR